MIEIRVNHRPHLVDFIRLNEEWIARYFHLEEADRKLAANPGQVINAGGYVFTGTVDDKVVAVCALFRENDERYELARMAVSPEHQGKGYGKKLMQMALNHAATIGARTVYLVSNTILEPAIALYKKSGFSVVHQGPHPEYARANIMMERIL